MPAVKRPRRFGTKTHLIQLGTHFWSQDPHEYAKPAQRVYDWASIMIIVCFSSGSASTSSHHVDPAPIEDCTIG